MEDIDVLTAISPKLQFLGISSYFIHFQFHPLFSETPRDLRGHGKAGCTPGPLCAVETALRWRCKAWACETRGPTCEGSFGTWIGDFFPFLFKFLFHGKSNHLLMNKLIADITTEISVKKKWWIAVLDSCVLSLVYRRELVAHTRWLVTFPAHRLLCDVWECPVALVSSN